MNAKISVFIICVDCMLIYWLLAVDLKMHKDVATIKPL